MSVFYYRNEHIHTKGKIKIAEYAETAGLRSAGASKVLQFIQVMMTYVIINLRIFPGRTPDSSEQLHIFVCILTLSPS